LLNDYRALFFFFWTVHRHRLQPPEPVQLARAAEEEAQVAHRVHQPPDLRAGETLPVPEVPVAGGPGRDRVQPGSDQRAGDHVVPEQAGQDEAGLRGTEEGPGDAGRAQRAQDIPGDRPEHGHTQEEAAAAGGGRVRLAHRRPPGQVRRVAARSLRTLVSSASVVYDTCLCIHVRFRRTVVTVTGRIFLFW